MMVWLSMSCMYVSVRTAAGGTSYFGMSAQGMASRSRAPERATQASRSNRAIAVGQKYYPRRVQNSGKASPGRRPYLVDTAGEPQADGLSCGRRQVDGHSGLRLG